MKKRILFCALCTIFLLPSLAECKESSRRGLFVAMLEEPSALSSRGEIAKLVGFAKRTHSDILFVQIYRTNKAYFPSKVADTTPYEMCLKNVSEDPFRLLIRQAHDSGIRVYAWLNMLSLGENKDAIFLKKYGTSILTRNIKKKKRLEDYKIDDQYFLEPGDIRIRDELSEIIGEIVRAYPEMDGILFDYVRYPDKEPHYGYTENNVERFKKTTGTKEVEESGKAWQDWKRAQVTDTLRQFVNKARALRPDIQVSATGCMPYSRAYYEAFQDWPLWLKTRLVDFVAVMAYSPYPAEFEEWISDIKNRIPDFKKVDIGMGAYKLASSPDEFERELGFCERSGCGACVIFHYSSLLRSPAITGHLSRR